MIKIDQDFDDLSYVNISFMYYQYLIKDLLYIIINIIHFNQSKSSIISLILIPFFLVSQQPLLLIITLYYLSFD